MREFTSTPVAGQTDDPNPLEGLQFSIDGVVFRCEGRPRMLDESELALLAVQATDIRTPQARAAIAAFLQMALGAVQYNRLRSHYHDHETPDDVLLEIMDLINSHLSVATEELTGRPTRPPLPSSAGQPDQGGRIAKVISLGTGEVRVVDEPGQDDPAQIKPGQEPKVVRRQPAGKGSRRTRAS